MRFILDRLWIIILTVFFPFYKSHPNETSRLDPNLVNQSSTELRLGNRTLSFHALCIDSLQP